MASVAMHAQSLGRWRQAGSPEQLTGLRKRFVEDALRPAPHTSPTRSIDAVLETIPGPDIEWNPSFETYMSRVEALSKLDIRRPSNVPEGFPAQIDSPRAWAGSDFRNENGYVLQLEESEVFEVERALSFFKARPQRLGPKDVSRDTFPLPTLCVKLEELSKALHGGIGFSVIRGLEPKRYSATDNLTIYLGLTSYVGETRGCQDSGGSMVIHVKDLGEERPNSDMRQSPYANNAQPFHNDVCDILAMYVLEQAAEGGESHLASCAAVYNEIAASRPDVIHTLAEASWIFDKHQTPAYWKTRSLLFNFGEHGPSFCFSRRPITGSPTSPRGPGVPPMTEVQAEALDMVHFTARRHQLTMRLQRGDIQLVNNLAVFHARNHFHDSSGQKRHIMRLWLRNEELAWETPAGLRKSWFEKYGDSDRRKIAKWNVHPGATRERILFRSESCT